MISCSSDWCRQLEFHKLFHHKILTILWLATLNLFFILHIFVFVYWFLPLKDRVFTLKSWLIPLVWYILFTKLLKVLWWVYVHKLLSCLWKRLIPFCPILQIFNWLRIFSYDLLGRIKFIFREFMIRFKHFCVSIWISRRSLLNFTKITEIFKIIYLTLANFLW